MTTYSNNCERLQDIITEAHSARISESDAKIWAKTFISELTSYEEVKDMAHHMSVRYVEVEHHQKIRAQLLKKIVEEMLDWESAEDDVDDYEYEYYEVGEL